MHAEFVCPKIVDDNPRRVDEVVRQHLDFEVVGKMQWNEKKEGGENLYWLCTKNGAGLYQ